MNRKFKKSLILATKIGAGVAIALAIAFFLNLDNPTAAGSITLLTLVTTKLGTFKLSIQRIVTYFITVFCSLILFTLIPSDWLAFGLLIFVVVLICYTFGWQGTLSVNALIAIHFLIERDFSLHFILNEFYLVLIGIVLAIIINMFHDYGGDEAALNEDIHYTEEEIQKLLTSIVHYIRTNEHNSSVWNDLDVLEKKIQEFMIHAIEYQDNTFSSLPQYYIDYFEMREFQCEILHMLHYELRKIRSMPKEAMIISEYIEYMIPYVTAKNEPTPQLERLEELLEEMRKGQLPATREEFENRAILYHILMDLEDFLLRKKKFVQGLSQKQKELYWKA